MILKVKVRKRKLKERVKSNIFLYVKYKEISSFVSLVANPPCK
jgi:hypothetical protein